jgi:hypothetical protein
MSSSYAISESITFTRTHARHIAARVSADLKRMQRFYGEPIDSHIDQYETELIELMVGAYLHAVTYGFRRNGHWIEPTVRYTARDLYGGTSVDDDPGGIMPGANISGATCGSFLTYSNAWDRLSEDQRDAVRARLPFQRTTGDEPGVDGYLSGDRSYSAGGRALDRQRVRSFGR